MLGWLHEVVNGWNDGMRYMVRWTDGLRERFALADVLSGGSSCPPLAVVRRDLHSKGERV
jgi:hypothetical protein